MEKDLRTGDNEKEEEKRDDEEEEETQGEEEEEEDEENNDKDAGVERGKTDANESGGKRRFRCKRRKARIERRRTMKAHQKDKS